MRINKQIPFKSGELTAHRYEQEKYFMSFKSIYTHN